MSISIALATFNGGRFIRRQLVTLAAQTVAPSELVVTDDGSRDETLAIVEKFSKTAPFPIRIVRNEGRLGYRANFMKAAELCTSDLVAFCDQDDVWESNKLELMTEQFVDPNVLLAFHGATLINTSENIIGQLFSSKNIIRYPRLSIRPKMIVPGFAQVFRRSLIRFTLLHAQSIDPYNNRQRMSHDLWFLFWASVLGEIVHVPQTLAHYRQHDANASGWIEDWSVAFILDNIRNAEFYARSNVVNMSNRLQLLHRARRLLADNETGRLDAAIELYEMLASRTDQRWSVYTGRTFLERVRKLASLVRQGGYTGKKAESLGLDTLLLDTFVGVPFAGMYATD